MNPIKLITKPIGCLVSLLSGLLLLLVIGVALLYWAATAWSPGVLATWMEQHSGFGARIDDASLELLDQQIAFEDIVVTNPDSFPEEDFLRIRRLAFKLPYARAFGGDFRATAAELEIDSLTIVIPPDGDSNVGQFIDSVYRKERESLMETHSGQTLDTFRIFIGEVLIENHRFDRPSLQKVSLDYEAVFTDVNQADAVFAQVRQELSQRGLPGVSPAFFEAIFATLPVQCFADIPPVAPDLIPDGIEDTVRKHGDEAKKALESL